MIKRWFLTLLGLPLLVIGAAFSLTPLLLLQPRLESPLFEQAACLWGSLVVLLLIPTGNALLSKIWFFRGVAEPVPLEQLHERLLAVNGLVCPVSAREKRDRIIFSWRRTEARWCELFSRQGMERLYEVRCRFDTDTRTVFLVDRMRAVDFVVCPDHVRTGFARICLPSLCSRHRRLTAIDQFAALEAYEYDFHLREIKAPVLGTILASGWNVRFSLF
jgi:hypothetical protein